MSGESKIQELLKHFSVYGLGSITQAAAAFLLLPIITKYLSPEDYGIYTLITLVGVLANTIFYLGITTALPRSFFDYPEGIARNRVLTTGLLLVLAGACLQIILGFFLSSVISIQLFESVTYSKEIFMMLIASAIAFINTFFQTYFRLLNQSKTVVIQGVATSLVNFFVAILLLKTTSLRIWAPIFSFFLGQALILIYSILKAHKQIRGGFDYKEAVLMMRLGLPAILTSIAVSGMEWSDRFFINKFLSLADVGIYTLAFKFGSIINPLLISPFVQIWNPLMMKYRESSDIGHFFSRVFNYYFAICGLFILLFMLLFSEISSLVIKNPDYHKAFFIIPLIMLSTCIYGSTNFLSAGFFYSRDIRQIPIIYFIFSIISIVCNFILVPRLGYWGAALSGLFIYTLLPTAVYLRSKAHFAFKINYPIILTLLLSNFILAFLAVYIRELDWQLRITLKVIIVLLAVLIISFLVLDRSSFKGLLKGNIKDVFRKNSY